MSNCPLWIFEQQQVTEVPCCPLMNPNECCFKHINGIHMSISATTGALLAPSTFSILYGRPAGGNLVSVPCNFPQGAGSSWRSASPLPVSFTWYYSVVEAISCSHDPWMSLTPCHLTSWLGIEFRDNRASWQGCLQIVWGSCCGHNMQSYALTQTKGANFRTLDTNSLHLKNAP